MKGKKCWNCDKPCDTKEKLKDSRGHRLCSSCYDDIRERLLIAHHDLGKAADHLNRFAELTKINKERNNKMMRTK